MNWFLEIEFRVLSYKPTAGVNSRARRHRPPESGARLILWRWYDKPRATFPTFALRFRLVFRADESKRFRIAAISPSLMHHNFGLRLQFFNVVVHFVGIGPVGFNIARVKRILLYGYDVPSACRQQLAQRFAASVFVSAIRLAFRIVRISLSRFNVRPMPLQRRTAQVRPARCKFMAAFFSELWQIARGILRKAIADNEETNRACVRGGHQRR